MRHLIILHILLCAVCQQCLGTSMLTGKSWIRGYNSLQDYEIIDTQTASSDMKCTALASRQSLAHLATYNSSTGVCRVYKCSEPLPQFKKCRDITSPKRLVWFLSSRIPSPCWSTVQRRVSNSVDFYRTWAAYKAGFGDGPNGNFWIGLDSLHSLTSVSEERKVMFMLRSWNDSQSWAQYSSFSVGPEIDQYRLTVSGFSSSHPAIGDSFSTTSGSWFSTKDRDNDGISGNIAMSYNGAWWFNAMSQTNLNGPYVSYPAAVSTSFGQGLIWLNPFGYYYSLKEIEMLIL